MAARTRSGTKTQPWDRRTRDRIRTSMLINRLTDYVESKVELESAQVTAALGLLKKTLPDLNAVTLSGDDENPIRHEHTALDDFLGRMSGIAARSGAAPTNGKANGRGSESS